MLFRLLFFHSLRTIPHTFENNIFKDIKIHHENASKTGDPVKKLFPTSSPKN